MCACSYTCADPFLHVCVVFVCQHAYIKDTRLCFFYSVSPLKKKKGDIFSRGWATLIGWWHCDWSHGNWNWTISILHNENRTLTSALNVRTNLERQKIRVVCVSREAACPPGTSLQRWLIPSLYLPWEGHTDDSAEGWVCAQSAWPVKNSTYIFISAWTKARVASKRFSGLSVARAMTSASPSGRCSSSSSIIFI